jgi:hypothetical protein
MNDKAIGLIGLNLSNSMLMNVSGETTTKKLWDNLGLLYEVNFLVNLLFLWKKLYALKMKDSDGVTDHLNSFNGLLNHLKAINGKVNGSEGCIALPCSLPNSWENQIVTINGATKVENLKLDEIMGHLL